MKKDVFVAIVPVTGKLNLKRTAAALKVKKLRMTEPKDAERLNGIHRRRDQSRRAKESVSHRHRQ